QSALRWKRGRGGAAAFRLQNQRHADSVSSVDRELARERRKVRRGDRRGFALSRGPGGFREDEETSARNLSPLGGGELARERVRRRGRGGEDKHPLFREGPPDREDLVFRPRRHEGR